MRLMLMTPLTGRELAYPINGLGYLAAHTCDLVDDVTVFIGRAEDATREAFHERLAAFRPDIVGINMYSSDFSATRRTATWLREACPEALIILGGPHPSGDPKGTLNAFPEVDLCFQGEAEIGFRQLLEAGRESPAALRDPDRWRRIPGLCHRDGDGIACNPPEMPHDLDALPMPAYDLLRPDTFFSASGSGYQKDHRIGYVTSSRGCVRRCAFCSGHTVSGRKVRLRAPAKVVEGIRFLHDQYGIREIQFTDSDIAHDTDHLQALCEQLLESGLQMHWSCAACSDSLGESLLTLMRRAGCYMVRIGIETSTPRLLRMLHKAVDLDKVNENIRQMRAVGIRAHGFFMLGFPTETRDEMLATLHYAFASQLDSASFSIFQPLPGCELFDRHVDPETRARLDWDNFDFSKDSHYRTTATRFRTRTSRSSSDMPTSGSISTRAGSGN